MKVYPVSYITNIIRLYTKLSELWIVKLLSNAKINAVRKFNVNVWCLQCRNIGKLINTVHHIHNTTSSHERLFAGQQSSLTLRSLYANSLGLHHYSINSLLYLRRVQDKYIAIYRELITQLHIYATSIRILAKGYLPISLVTPSKLREILNDVKTAIWKSSSRL